MSKEIIQTENKKADKIDQELIALSDENINIMNETYNKFNTIIYNNDELNKFKDNILSLLKERDKIYLDKLVEYKTKTEKIKMHFDSINKITNSKFSKIIDNQANMNSRLDQLNNYESFVTKTNDKLISHEVRLTNIREDFSNATQKYDKIYLDNLELPGYIGRGAKYKNCQIFFLDIIKDLAKLNKYKEKNIIDLKMYKDKLETIISSMNSILDNNNQSQIKYINETKEKILKDCNNMFESVCDNMKEIRVDNSKYAVDLISTSMDLSKKWDKIEKIREDLLEKFNYSVNKYQMLTDDTIKSFGEFKTEYSIVRRKFMELAEFIKDVRFRKNIGENVKKKEIKVMVKKMLKKRKSFEAKDVHLLSDISTIENIDYKKYYHIDTKNNENNNNDNNENNDNRSSSLKVSQNKIDKKHKNLRRNNNNINSNYSMPKEASYRRDLNQSAEETRSHRMNIVNPLTSSTNNINSNVYVDKSNKSINISPLNVKDLKNSHAINNSAIVSNRNTNIKKENNIDIKFRYKLDINDKKNEVKNIKDKIEKKQKSKEKDKDKNYEQENDITIEDNTITNHNNVTNNKTNKEIKSNLINDNNQNKQNQNMKGEIYYMSSNNNNNNNNNENETNTKSEEIQEPQFNQFNEKENISINYNIENKNIDINKYKELTKNKSFQNNLDNIDKKEFSTQINDKAKERNDENSQISSSRIMTYRSNIEIKPSLLDDASSISEGYNTNDAKNKNNNIGLSSEKSLSFISDNNNNINKFLINDILIENNDRIIKELASELEQSTAKKDKLASNKKEIEQKFKNACNSIEPINLLGQKENNTKIINNPNEIICNKNIVKNNNIQSNNNNNNNINNNENENENEEQRINNNLDKEIKNTNNEFTGQVNKNIIDKNNNINYGELPQSKTTEEDNNSNNYNINIISSKNISELKHNSPNEQDGNKNIKNINKSINDSITNLNPIKVNNEIYINDGLNSNTFNKKLHAVDQKLLNLELYTKEKILDLITQINLIKHTCNLPINDSFVKEKSNLDTSKISYLSNKNLTNQKYKTFNNSFCNNSNLNNQQNPFYNEKNKENISLNNNDNNNRIYKINNNNNTNSQNIYNNNNEKKRYSLKEVNPKFSFLNQKLSQKNSINNIINSNMNNNIYLNNIRQNNSLTDNNNGYNINNRRNGNFKEIIDGNNSNNNLIHNINNDINSKILKEIDKRGETGNYTKNINNDELYNKNSNKNLNLNYDSNKKNFAYSNSTFTGTEIKLVDLNKLVNHQLPRNRLIPIKINDSDYYVSLNSK